jgi:cell division protein FtsW
MSGTTPRRNHGRHRPSRPPGQDLASVTMLRRPAATPVRSTGSAPRQEGRRRRKVAPTPPAHPNRVLGLSLIVGLLCVVGLVMVLSASAAEAQSEYGTPWYHLQRQAIFLAVGVVALLVASYVDLQRVRSLVRPLVAVTAALLVVVLLPFAGQTVNGATRWLALGPVTIQPSELAKLALILFAADLLAARATQMHVARATSRPVLLVFGMFAVLIMLQPNLGTTAVLFVIVAAVLWVAGMPPLRMAALLAGAASLGVAAAVLAPYRFARITAFVDPWADRFNTGYQTLQSQAALANGGVAGLGLGQGRAKFGFLPEVHTDFIFSTIGEEFGLLGGLFVVALFVGLALFGAGVAMRAADRFGMLVAVGVTTWITFQALVNLGAVVGVLPITGVPLPLVSAGGSSMVVTLAACGLLINVARTARI